MLIHIVLLKGFAILLKVLLVHCEEGPNRGNLYEAILARTKKKQQKWSFCERGEHLHIVQQCSEVLDNVDQGSGMLGNVQQCSGIINLTV